MNDIKDAIEKWIIDFVETDHPHWGNLPPCPYAREARNKENNVDIQVQDEQDYYIFLDQQIESFFNSDLNVRLVIAKDKNTIDPVLYTKHINNVNKELIQHKLLLLTDHPDILEFRNGGVNVQQGTYVVTFIQRIKKLEQSCQKLHYSDYYTNWPAEMYKAIVLDRYDKLKTYKNGPVDGPIVEHKKPDWMKQK